MKIKKTDDYLLKIGELRQLLFWATFGVENARGGGYQKTIIPLILRLAKDIKFPIRNSEKDPLIFGKYLQ